MDVDAVFAARSSRKALERHVDLCAVFHAREDGFAQDVALHIAEFGSRLGRALRPDRIADHGQNEKRQTCPRDSMHTSP